MKRRIEQLLNGIFEYEPARLSIVPEKLEIEVQPGTVCHGTLYISGENDKKVKGFLYVPSPRILCEPTVFQGMDNEIHYQIDCSGFEPGMEEEGVITISSDAGEYAVPYHIRSEKKQQEESVPFDSLDDFAALAKENYRKAYRYFASSAFRGFLKEKASGQTELYNSLVLPECSLSGMEEFLIGAKLKEPVRISVQQDALSWDGLSEPTRETLVLTKSTWGYKELAVTSDARFLRPEKKVITTDEFAGSTFDLNLVIDTNLMHAGKNCTWLKLSASDDTVTVPVTVSRTGNEKRCNQNRIRKTMMKKLEELYVDFRLKKIDLSVWTERSVSVISTYRRAGGQDPFAELFLVQLYFADGKTQKAYQILEGLEQQKHRLNTPERYGFYLYMTTFFYHEASYVDRVEQEISQLFYRNRTSWKLQWILLYLQESFLKDETARYEAVAAQFRYGCRSRIMYLEAYQILKANPFQMRHLGTFELHLLRFAAREGILTAELIRQTAALAAHTEQFSEQLYEVLTAGYQMYPSTDLLFAICHLLIAGQKKEDCYFAWYEKGVEAGLRLTGLYEYYMETMDCFDLVRLPQIIRMYFAYDTTLDYRKRAAIYRRMIENREQDMQTYHSYRAAIERFAVEQLEALHITEDLGVIYRSMLRRGMMTKQMAGKLTKLLFTYEICCDRPGIQQVVLHSGRLAAEQKVALSKGRALIRIYDPESILLLEDEQGRRHLLSELGGTVRSVFSDDNMLSWCAQLAGDAPGLVLYLSMRCMQESLIHERSLPYLLTACECADFSDDFRYKLREVVLQYYLEHLRDETLPDFLGRISKLEYVKVNKAALITLLAEEGRCSEAFGLLDRFGAENIPLLQLVRICSRMVLDLEFEENPMLIALCHHCFVSGKYDDKLLRYLIIYYEGPIEQMKRVWQAARKFELDTMMIEEKIMMLILFTRSETQGSEPVFESYLAKMGRRRICRAYVNLKAYEYFVKGLPVADSIFRFIEREYAYLSKKKRLEEQEEVCRLALLQHYVKMAELSPERRACVEKLLEEFCAKGMRFAFWLRFDGALLAPYQMDGRVFAEYVCDPQHTVHICWRLKGSGSEYEKEPVPDIFNGIFVREFTLFDGEELECWFEEADGETVRKTDRRVLQAPETVGQNGRYAMLNRIFRQKQNGKEEQLQAELESYRMLEYLTEHVFTLV